MPKHTNYPRTPNTKHDTQSDILTFLCEKSGREVLPPPVPAETHIQHNRENFQRNTSLQQQITSQLQTTTTTKTAMKTGWILSVPRTQSIDTRKETPQIQSPNQAHRTENKPPTHNARNKYIEINTEWTANINEEYVLLIQHPPCVPKTKYQVIPTVLDMDTAKQQIKPVVKLTPGKHWQLHYGQPIAHVIPIPKQTQQ